MENTKNYGVWIIGLALLAFSAIFFLSAESFSKQGSYVEVKGLSEKIVKADTAIWAINFEVKSNNVDSLYADIEKNVTTIKTFLKEKGFEESEINVAPVYTYQDTYKEALFRYNSITNQQRGINGSTNIRSKTASGSCKDQKGIRRETSFD